MKAHVPFRFLAVLAATALLGTGASVPAQAAPVTVSAPAAGHAHVDRARDFDGDGNADVLARDSHGVLWLYPGNGHGGFKDRRRIGGGWDSMTAIITGYFTLSGHNDLVARDRYGTLWLYPGNGHGGFGVRKAFASGWNEHNPVIGTSYDPVKVGSILGLDRGHDALWQYLYNRGREMFYFFPHHPGPYLLGTGFDKYHAIVSVGDWNRDGRSGDLVMTSSAYVLEWSAGSNSLVKLASAVPVRGLPGWRDVYTQMISPLDFDGRTGAPELIGRDTHGDLWLISHDLRHRTKIGNGWNGWTLI